MIAAVLEKPYDIRIKEVDQPKVGPKDVLLENIHTGVCGTDVNHYKGFELGQRVFPFVPGHECSGVVAEVGEEVSDFQVGDKVYALKHGSLVQYLLTHLGDRIYKLPENASLVDVTSLFPISGILHAINKSGIKIGDNVVILGPGHAGLVLTQWARIAGAGRVIVTGTRENRLKVAKEVGADFTVNIREEDPVEKVKEYTDGVGPDVIIEAAGRPDAVVQAIEMVKRDGTIVIFGVAQEPVEKFDTFQVYWKNITLFGTHGRTDEEREIGAKYLLSGKISVKPIITHILPLEETKKGFEMVDKRLDDVIRMVIKSP